MPIRLAIPPLYGMHQSASSRGVERLEGARRLDGTWDLYWQELVPPSAPDTASVEPVPVTVVASIFLDGFETADTGGWTATVGSRR